MKDEIKNRMAALHLSQSGMVLKLQERGLIVSPSEMSIILRCVLNTPKAKMVRNECEKVLTELENAN